jgi:hypothetical protein
MTFIFRKIDINNIIYEMPNEINNLVYELFIFIKQIDNIV